MLESYYLSVKQGLMPVPIVGPCQVGSDLDVPSENDERGEIVGPCQVGSDLDCRASIRFLLLIVGPCQVGSDLDVMIS